MSKCHSAEVSTLYNLNEQCKFSGAKTAQITMMKLTSALSFSFYPISNVWSLKNREIERHIKKRHQRYPISNVWSLKNREIERHIKKRHQRRRIKRHKMSSS